MIYMQLCLSGARAAAGQAAQRSRLDGSHRWATCPWGEQGMLSCPAGPWLWETQAGAPKHHMAPWSAPGHLADTSLLMAVKM